MPIEKKLLTITVPAEAESVRIDKFLSGVEEIKSRSRAEYLIEKNLVTVNNRVVKSSFKIKPTDIIEVSLHDLISDSPVLEKLNLELNILFEDENLLVINKPSGLVVHPAAGHQNDTLVNALLAHTKNLSMKFGEDRPGIVHRLDKETSGLLVVAKNDEAHHGLSVQFKNRTITRFYEAIVTGTPVPSEGRIVSFLARKENDRKKYSSLRDAKNKIIRDSTFDAPIGKLAITNYYLLRRSYCLSLMKLKLETGRTHQIRVHMSELGHPIIGDVTYGAKSKEKNLNQELLCDIQSANRFFLHAKTLGFVHPQTKKELLFEIDWPTQEKEFINKWLPHDK